MTLVKTKYNRRSFLKVSAASSGGMMLGFSWLASCNPTKEQALSMPESWFDINAFIKIGENGLVTIFSPNPEIGQNIKTSMPMVVAEELDVAWKNVVVEQAALDTHKYERQIAGGSQSIRRGWQGLRMAGATARHMLMEAAAKEWKVTVSSLSTKEGVIKHDESNRTMSYGQMAAIASTLKVPEKVELKDPKDFKIIGQPTKNVDGKKIISGAPIFGLDFKREGMKISMIEHSPAFGMKLKSFNEEVIKSMPGISDVLVINTAPKEAVWSNVNAFTEVIAIVGDTTWQVMKAKKGLIVEWEWDSPAENSQDHEFKLEQSLQTGVKQWARKDGNPEQTFKNASQVIEKTFSAPFLAHNTMEPMNFFAEVSKEKAELIGPIQTPKSMGKSISNLLDIPIENITVMLTRMGGGFGRRLYGNFGLEAATISYKTGKPIKLIYTREDDMTQGVYRPAYKVKYRAALDEKNELIGFSIHGTGIHESPVYENRFPAGAVPNYLAEKMSIDSNISTGAWRAPRSNFIAGAEQSFLDEVAEAAGKDPIDFRLELFDRAIKNPIGSDNDYDPERYAGVLKLVRDKSNWGIKTEGVYRGVSAYFCHNTYVAQVLDMVLVNGKHKIKKVWCAIDCGIVINPEGAINQAEGGIIDGIGHAMYSNLTFDKGSPIQKNFDTYSMIRHHQAPSEIEVFFVDNGIDPTGLGEPTLPPISGALANAIYQASGQRLYKQPFIQQDIKLG